MTPLWCAAAKGRFEVVKLLQELGADINAASNIGTTAVNHACIESETDTVEFLVRQGADVNRPDERGETCLMNSVRIWKLCQFLVDNGGGGGVEAQDSHGNTALHHAIRRDNLMVVRLLLDHGLDQNTKNKLGDDALQFASLHGRVSIVTELVARQKPTALRWIESLQLLGSHSFFTKEADSFEQAVFYWKKSVKYRIMHPCAESRKCESMPACLIVQELSMVEELEEICQDEQMVHIYALGNMLRILGSSHKETTDRLVIVSSVFDRNMEYRRSLDLLKYTFQLLHERTPMLTKDYNLVLTKFRWILFKRPEFEIGFHDVVEILDMVTLKAQFAFTVRWQTILYVMRHILVFVYFLVIQNKSPDQMISFKRIIHRLVHSQIRDNYGRTLLHYAVVTYDTYPGVAEVLLECGADANSVDTYHNTALHLRTCPYVNSGSFPKNEKSKVIKLLLRYSAHPDIVNDRGDFAANGLSLNMLDHVNLKCLATAVIRDHQIPYVGQIPKSLESFVQMHGRCPSRNFQCKSWGKVSKVFL